MDIKNIIRQVKYNCNISDAGFWGYYSICGLLMRLRDLYFHEHSIKADQFVPKKDILDWIAQRESLWEALADAPLQDIEIEGCRYGPFDTAGINTVLIEQNLVYSGGYGMFGKPMFFLASLRHKRYVNSYGIYYSENEYCHDLSTSLAMAQGHNIFVRLEPIRKFLNEKILELQGGKHRTSLRQAFRHYSIADKNTLLSSACNEAVQDVAELIALHELGEASENEIAPNWLDILDNTTDRLTEIYLRAIKDVLADTTEMGPLMFIVQNKSVHLLNFYIAFLEGLRKEIFPEVMEAYNCFTETGNWTLVERARISGYTKMDKLRREILKLWQDTGNIKTIESFIRSCFKKE